jgi:hypothetical protein
MYADDCKIFKQISCDDDVTKLQEDIDRYNRLCAGNKIDANVEKCCHITFSRSKTRVA